MAAARTQPLAAASGEITIAEPLARRSYAASIKKAQLTMELASSRSLSIAPACLLVLLSLSLSPSFLGSTRSADRVASLSLSLSPRCLAVFSLSSSLLVAAMSQQHGRRCSGVRAVAEWRRRWHGADFAIRHWRSTRRCVCTCCMSGLRWLRRHSRSGAAAEAAPSSPFASLALRSAC